MKIAAWILLGLVLFVIIALMLYLLIGAIIFKFVFSRRSLCERVIRKDIEKRIKENKIDLCWWEKIKLQDVEITSVDGLKLKGKYFDSGSDKTALILHGFGGTYLEMQQFCKYFHDKNYNFLAVDCRAHGQSEGGCVGYGWLDRLDIVSWANFLKEKTPNAKVVLFGLSMGGAAVCMASGEKNLPDNVVAIISDCAFDTLDNQFRFIISKRKILWLFKSHLYSYMRHVYNFDISKADALKQVKKTRVPILFIHGEADRFVPPECSKNLYNSTPENLRELFFVPEAGHGMAYPVAGVLYEKKVSDFLKTRTPL